MLNTTVPISPKRLEDYTPIAGNEEMGAIEAAAGPLRGKSVLHINSTAFGGGVAELLYTLVPLMNDIGLDAEWRVIDGSNEFFEITKLIHNGLQGMDIPWTETMAGTYLENNRINAEALRGSYDVVVVHDPQPAAIPFFLGERMRQVGKKWIWRCHIDLTESDDEIWDFLKPHVDLFDAAIFTVDRYAKPGMEVGCIAIIPPAIDPLSPKNVSLEFDTVMTILRSYNIDPSRPIITQVARFDPWKDPLGVIDAYRLVKEDVPDLQLLMVASMATDDPEGWHYYEKTARHCGEDFDIFLLSNLQGVGHTQVNAMQRASDVVIQKSVREGFGLTVAEALWKERPVVAGYAGGIPLQVQDNVNGFLVSDVEGCAKRTLQLLRDRPLSAKMGARGHERVREHFLSTRNLRNYLELMGSLFNGG